MFADTSLIHKTLHQRHAVKGVTGLSEYSIGWFTIRVIVPHALIPRINDPLHHSCPLYCIIQDESGGGVAARAGEVKAVSRSLKDFGILPPWAMQQRLCECFEFLPGFRPEPLV